jgi:hypothetical protein
MLSRCSTSSQQKEEFLTLSAPRPSCLAGETIDYKKHLSLKVGQYCQVHKEDTTRNGQSPRTKGAILIGLSGNLQEGYKFMALNTGKKVFDEAGMWFPCQIRSLLVWMHWELTNTNNLFLLINVDAWSVRLKSQGWWILKKMMMMPKCQYWIIQ